MPRGKRDVTKLRNYTSAISVQQTLSEIDALLLANNSSGISKVFRDGEVVEIIFTIKDQDQYQLNVQISVDVESVKQVLVEEMQSSRSRKIRADTLSNVEDQAKRTAWRLQYEMLALQMSAIKLKQAKIDQVFLANIVSQNGTTIYSALSSGKTKLLGLTHEKET